MSAQIDTAAGGGPRQAATDEYSHPISVRGKAEGGTRQPEKGAELVGARRNFRTRVGLGLGLVVVAAGGWWLYSRQFEDTDDAQIDGDIISVSARVAGTVTAVPVVDNQPVKAGDILVELDPTDLQVAVAQAKAAVAQAEAAYEAQSPSTSILETSNRAAIIGADTEVNNTTADLEAAQRELDQAEANNRFAQLQLERGKQLIAANAISRADFDQRSTVAETAEAATKAARKRVEQRRARLLNAESRLKETKQNAPRQLESREAELKVRAANLDLARAQLRQAELNLSYGKVLASVTGVVGRKSVHLGERVQSGQQLMAIAQTENLWVTANFRETQVRHMRPGQKATVHVDAYNADYDGTVESFAAATGSRYSLLPPENASGNYVKVVQRIPVRIQLKVSPAEMSRLRPGMSVEPKVRVR